MIVSNTDIKDTLSSISSEVLNGINYSRSEYARQILNYPAMMVPSVQEPIIRRLAESLNREVSLLDPFMGASNTLVTGMKYGLNVFGQDINPLSLLVSQVKTSFYCFEELMLVFDSIKSRVLVDNSVAKEVFFKNIDKWFKEEVQIELSKIHRAIQKEPDLKIRKFLWIALAEVIRLSSNDRTSTFKMHCRPLEEINNRKVSPIDYFFSILRRSIIDINDFCSILVDKKLIKNNEYIKDNEVVWGDSKVEIKTNKTFDLLITSPPYGDNLTTVTYGQFSYLPLQWIPVEDIDEGIGINYLNTIQSIDSNSLGGKMITNFLTQKEKIFEKSGSLQKLFGTFNDDEILKAKKLINFFHDLDLTLDNILLKLKNDAFLVWTIGNRSVNQRVVRNDLILTELFSSKNVDLIADLDRDILSKRMPSRNNFSDMMCREKILIFKMSPK